MVYTYICCVDIHGLNIVCPDNEDCNVDCHDPNVEVNSQALNASMIEDCSYETIVCPSDHDCEINCYGFKYCSHSTIVCPSNANCNILCQAKMSCLFSSILWPTDSSTANSLICGATGSCRSLTFPAPDPYTASTITCDGISECASSIIQCPRNADCTVICSADLSCDETMIIWPSDPTVTNTLNCSHQSACSEDTTPPPDHTLIVPDDMDYHLTCTVDEPCNEALVVDCPLDYGCFIECRGTQCV